MLHVLPPGALEAVPCHVMDILFVQSDVSDGPGNVYPVFSFFLLSIGNRVGKRKKNYATSSVGSNNSTNF